MDQHWEDQYLSQDATNGLWTCWDQKGECIGVAKDYDAARKVVQDYVEQRMQPRGSRAEKTK